MAASPLPVAVGGTTIPVADIALLAAMKAGAVHDRGAKRDFIDVHAICGTPGWSVGRFIEHAAAKLPLTTDQVRRALTYFVDADKQPTPRGPVPPWEIVKTALTKGVLEWERSPARMKGPDFDR